LNIIYNFCYIILLIAFIINTLARLIKNSINNSSR